MIYKQIQWLVVSMIIANIKAWNITNIKCGTHGNSTNGACQSQILQCEDGIDCHINCLYKNSCIDKIIVCPQDNQCIINCFGKSSCHNINVDATDSSELQFICNDYDSVDSVHSVCTHSDIYCPINNHSINPLCIITGTNQAGFHDMRIYAVNGFNDVIFNINYSISNMFIYCRFDYDIGCKINDIYPHNSCNYGGYICLSTSTTAIPIDNIDPIDTETGDTEYNKDVIAFNSSDLWMLYILIMILIILCCVCVATLSVILFYLYCRTKTDEHMMSTKAMIKHEHFHSVPSLSPNSYPHNSENHDLSNHLQLSMIKSPSKPSKNTLDAISRPLSEYKHHSDDFTLNQHRKSIKLHKSSIETTSVKTRKKKSKHNYNDNTHPLSQWEYIKNERINMSSSPSDMSSSNGIDDDIESLHLSVKIVPLNDMNNVEKPSQCIDINDALNIDINEINSNDGNDSMKVNHYKQSVDTLCTNISKTEQERNRNTSIVSKRSEGKPSKIFTMNQQTFLPPINPKIMMRVHTKSKNEIDDDKFDEMVTTAPSPPPSEPTLSVFNNNTTSYFD